LLSEWHPDTLAASLASAAAPESAEPADCYDAASDLLSKITRQSRADGATQVYLTQRLRIKELDGTETEQQMDYPPPSGMRKHFIYWHKGLEGARCLSRLLATSSLPWPNVSSAGEVLRLAWQSLTRKHRDTRHFLYHRIR
jgi:hypothetical protein